MYQIGIGLIWLINRPKRSGNIEQLYQKDVQIQTARQSILPELQLGLNGSALDLLRKSQQQPADSQPKTNRVEITEPS
jgi:hypothetical protein